jgi:hypothetical protein
MRRFSGILFADAFLCSLGRICLMGILADWLVRQVPNPLVVATLVPIVGGVALASLTEASFNWYVPQTVLFGMDSIYRRLLLFFFFFRKQLHQWSCSCSFSKAGRLEVSSSSEFLPL